MAALVTALICSFLTGAWSPAHNFVRVQNEPLCLFGRATSSSANAEAITTTTTTVSSASTILLPLSTAAKDLQNLLKAQDDSPVQVEGYITAKRGFGDSFCFLDLSDSENFESPIQVMVKRQEFVADDGDRSFDGYMKSMLPGARVRISGISSPSRNPDEALLLARRMRLVGLPRNPQFIGAILQAVHDGLLPLEEVAQAASWSVSDLSVALKDTAAAAAASVGVLPNQDRPDSWKGLAKAVLESMPPPEENFPYDFLRRKHDQGVYTLPRPEEEFRQPPALVLQSIVQPNSSDDAATTEALSSSTTASSFSVQELIANATTTAGDHNNGATNTAVKVVVDGWIQNRRRFHHNVTLLELVDDWERGDSATNDALGDVSKHAELWNRRLKCVLHPDCCTTEANTSRCGVWGQVLAPGSRVRLMGYYCSIQQAGEGSTRTSRQQPLLWVVQVRILRASWRPSVVRHLIELVVKKEFAVQEARDALNRSDAEMEEILQMTDLTARQWEANVISAELQDSQSRVAAVNPTMLTLLDQFESLRARYPVQRVENHDLMQQDTFREGSRWKRKKEPQLIWMAQQVKEAVLNHPEYGKRPLKVLDVGGGKGYLANHLATVLGDLVTIQVIDVAQGAVKNGSMRSKRLQLPVKYTVGDASKANFQGEVDLVVALHACGALTDVALGHAAANNAGFVICPCCFRSNPLLKVASYSDGKQLQMLAEDWLSVNATQYDSLKLLAEVQGDITLANKAIHSICAMRASALESRTEGRLMVSIKSFSVAFSSRNFCLVGRTRSCDGSHIGLAFPSL